MGSSDRRMTSRLCYNFLRIGDFAKDTSMEERIVYAEYLCEQDSPIVALLRPDLYVSMGDSLETKIAKVEADTNLFFPFSGEFSDGINKEAFLQSQLVQPDLFIRIKKGKEGSVRKELGNRHIPFREISEGTLALPNGSRLQDLSTIKGDYEVQDWSSQRTIDFIHAEKDERWWDACAGSGGKALLFLDRYPKTNLMVSDVRLSILRNLDERFEQAKIKNAYRKKIIDLTGDISSVLGKETFDGIILDIPCSGSGTWGRTPEMKVQFSKEKLNTFAQLQQHIISNVIAYLKPGKVLTYITCSVYKAENEDVVNHITARHRLQIKDMRILDGYREKADTMFVARLFKP